MDDSQCHVFVQSAFSDEMLLENIWAWLTLLVINILHFQPGGHRGWYGYGVERGGGGGGERELGYMYSAHTCLERCTYALYMYTHCTSLYQMFTTFHQLTKAVERRKALNCSTPHSKLKCHGSQSDS